MGTARTDSIFPYFPISNFHVQHFEMNRISIKTQNLSWFQFIVHESLLVNAWPQKYVTTLISPAIIWHHSSVWLRALHNRFQSRSYREVWCDLKCQEIEKTSMWRINQASLNLSRVCGKIKVYLTFIINSNSDGSDNLSENFSVYFFVTF